jgi:hypothetical protein
MSGNTDLETFKNALGFMGLEYGEEDGGYGTSVFMDDGEGGVVFTFGRNGEFSALSFYRE